MKSISVIIPAHNEEKYVARCINSVRAAAGKFRGDVEIIVVCNLTPARLTGVTSEGMLLAATNSACGVKVIFVDDKVPEGTRIC